MAAAFYNRQMAAQTRQQVAVAEAALHKANEVSERQAVDAQNALGQARLDSQQRYREAEEARRTAQATLIESVKSRPDQTAPLVTVSCEGYVAHRIEGSRTEDDIRILGDYVPRSALASSELTLYLPIFITNYGSLPVTLSFGSNPLVLADGPLNNVAIVMPKHPPKLIYTLGPLPYSEWERISTQGFGADGASDNPWQLTYRFEVANPLGQIVDEHTYRIMVRPFVSHGNNYRFSSTR